MIALLLNSAFAATVVIGVRSELARLDPFAPATVENYRVVSLTHEPLARVNSKTGALEPWLAKSWVVRGEHVVVELREGVRAHDGGHLTAADVVASLMAYRVRGAATWTPLWSRVTEIRARGRHRVDIRAVNLDYDTFRNVMTTMRLTRATGPYRVAQARGGVRLAPFARWWHGDAPSFDLHFKVVADESLAEARIAKGELDVFPDAERGRAVPGGTGFWIDLNLRREPFRSPDVRRALSLAWDRAALNQKYFGGTRRLGLDVFDPGMSWYPAGAADPFDPAAARRLLEGAGWRAGAKGLVRGSEPFRFELLVTDADTERWASTWAAGLSRLGIEAKISRVAADAHLLARLKDGAYDAFATGGGLAREVERDAWGSGAAYNTSGLRDGAVDASLAKLASAFDSSARAEILRDLIARVRELRPQIPGLVRDHGAILVSDRLRIDADHPFDVWRWRWNEKSAH